MDGQQRETLRKRNVSRSDETKVISKPTNRYSLDANKLTIRLKKGEKVAVIYPSFIICVSAKVKLAPGAVTERLTTATGEDDDNMVSFS